jgi:hypothetical protein
VRHCIGEAAGPALSIRPGHCLGTNASPAVRLSDGLAPTLSPDGKWVLGRSYSLQHALMLLPTGAGQSRNIPTGDVILFPGWPPHLGIRQSPR